MQEAAVSLLKGRPLYLQAYDVIAQKIASGEWSKGEPIPNEFDLSHKLDVSIGTLRKAIDLLVAERMLARRQGKGTFVRDRLSQDHRALFDPLRMRDGSLIEWQWTIVSRTIVPADAEGWAQLRCRPNAQLNRIERIGRNRGRPVRYDLAWLPVARFGDLTLIADSDLTLLVLAFRRGILLGGASEQIAIASATEEASAALGLPCGHPVLRAERVACDAEGVPLEWQRSQCHLVDEYYAVPLLGQPRAA
jgi:GntR family transcriptional regulator